MINTIIFDWGGVLAPADNRLAAERLYKKYGCDIQHLQSKIGAYERECSTNIDYFPFLVKLQREFRIPPSEMIAALLDTPPGKGFTFARKLAGKFKLCLLSNQMHFKTKHIRDTYDLSFFDVILFSSEIGVQKPDPKAFLLALAELQEPPSNCLFVDDNPQNLLSAEKLGLRTYHCTDINRLEQDLTPLLLDSNGGQR